MINRSRYDIYAEILMVLEFYGRAGISQIGRRANIPVDRVRTMLDLLIKRGLIVEIESDNKRLGVVYLATRRGGEFLALYKKMLRYVTEITEEEEKIWEFN